MKKKLEKVSKDGRKPSSRESQAVKFKQPSSPITSLEVMMQLGEAYDRVRSRVFAKAADLRPKDRVRFVWGKRIRFGRVEERAESTLALFPKGFESLWIRSPASATAPGAKSYNVHRSRVEKVEAHTKRRAKS